MPRARRCSFRCFRILDWPFPALIRVAGSLRSESGAHRRRSIAMADISGILNAIDTALGTSSPANATAPIADTGGDPSPVIVVRAPPRPRVVPGVAPAGDASAAPGNAIYSGGQAPSAAPPTA